MLQVSRTLFFCLRRRTLSGLKRAAAQVKSPRSCFRLVSSRAYECRAYGFRKFSSAEGSAWVCVALFCGDKARANLQTSHELAHQPEGSPKSAVSKVSSPLFCVFLFSAAFPEKKDKVLPKGASMVNLTQLFLLLRRFLSFGAQQELRRG